MVSAISQEQYDILLGLLLGDGNLESSGFKGARLQIKQSERKREYVEWLYGHFAELVRTPPKQRLDTKQWYFGTRYFENLETLRRMFYVNGRKIVPRNIADTLTSSLTLAIWYMDDGKLDYRPGSHYAFVLSTDSFTKHEVQLLQAVLLETFSVPTTLHMSLCRGKRYPKIYIGKDGRDKFFELVRPHVLSCFRYKLPPINHYLDPSETTRRAPKISSGNSFSIV